jgi:hypothetical protein
MSVVTIYDDANFQGNSTKLDVGRYDWGQLGISNDSLSSLKVPVGMIVTLYDDTHFGGKSKIFTQDNSYVGDDFNDITSSIEVEVLVTSLIKGYWHWTWSSSNAPADSTLSIAFSGWSDPDKALADSAPVKDKLVGDKYISLGGGNVNGKFDNSNIQRIIAAIENGKFSDYQGVVFDIEECDTGLASEFHAAFAIAKTKNLQVLVTVSHTAPYGAADAKDLMTAFFADENIDYLSPQLYTTGTETENDFSENMGVTWKDYVGAKAAMVPSIVRAGTYENAADFFSRVGIDTKGLIQWAQNS